MLRFENTSTQSMVFINLILYILLKKVYFFQMVIFKIYATKYFIALFGCHEHLPGIVTERCSLKTT